MIKELFFWNEKSNLYFNAVLVIFRIYNVAIASVGDEKYVKFTIYQKIYIVSGMQVEMDAAPFIENGRTYIPVRFLANSLAVPNDDIRLQLF